MKKQKKAFTLIETIIAISVFCIGILAALNGVTKTLRNQDYVNMQIKSAFFAREGIELMFNLRDANYHKEQHWNCIFEPKMIDPDHTYTDDVFCKGYFGLGGDNILKISPSSGSGYIYVETGDLEEDFNDNFDKFQIYFHTTGSIIGGETGFIYDYTGSEEEKTRFARYLVVTGVTDGSTNIDPDKLLKIESHVLYKKGALTGEKIMETFIGNYEF